LIAEIAPCPFSPNGLFIIRPIADDAMEIDVVAAWDSLGEYDTGLLPPGEFRMLRTGT